MGQFTIKDWFYNHPNITFALLGILYVWIVLATLSYLAEERWGWLAIGVLAAFSSWHYARDWWREQL
jgi:hypothetical protein